MIKKNKECHFCANNTEVDYKDVRTLKKFINFYQKIISAQRTGTCAWHQRKLTQAIKRARKMALVSFTHK
ncbi:MAG: 30S ribosomal protein S18 [Candidatus Falkowbacteria bacterium]